MSHVQAVCSLNVTKEEAMHGTDTSVAQQKSVAQQDCKIPKMSYLHYIMPPGEHGICFSSLSRVNRCTSRAGYPLQLPQQSASTVLVFLLRVSVLVLFIKTKHMLKCADRN